MLTKFDIIAISSKLLIVCFCWQNLIWFCEIRTEANLNIYLAEVYYILSNSML